MKVFSFKISDIEIDINIGFVILMLVILAKSGPVLTVGLILSIFGHELSHLLMARFLNYSANKMIFWLVGALAFIEKIKDSPKDELLISIAGPAFNFFVVCLLLSIGIYFPTISDSNHNILINLIVINFILGLFNLLPAYPTDGGRILKCSLELIGLSHHRALDIAHFTSSIFSALFVIFGIYYGWFGLLFVGIFIFSSVYLERTLED